MPSGFSNVVTGMPRFGWALMGDSGTGVDDGRAADGPRASEVIVSHETIHKARRSMNASSPPPTAHAQLALEHFLHYRFSVLSNRLSSAIARVYVERFALGVTA